MRHTLNLVVSPQQNKCDDELFYSPMRLSSDTSALTDSLSQIAEEMTARKDAVSSPAEAMGRIPRHRVELLNGVIIRKNTMMRNRMKGT